MFTGVAVGFAIGALVVFVIRKAAKPCGCHDEPAAGG